jgi:predicted nucleotidyltransferase
MSHCLDQKSLDLVTKILTKWINPSENSVFLFGSFVTGRIKKSSDLDIGIDGKAVDSSLMEKIREDFEESNLHYIVDLVDFTKLDPKFYESVKKNMVRIEL